MVAGDVAGLRDFAARAAVLQTQRPQDGVGGYRVFYFVGADGADFSIHFSVHALGLFPIMNQYTEILLVTPPYHSGVVESAGSWLPLSLLYVGGALQSAGFGVALYDAMTKFHTHDQVRETLRREQPPVVMVTAITATVLDAIDVCRMAKEEIPGVLTVLGGTHPNFMFDEILRNSPEVDVIVCGEGEETAVDLMRAWTAKDDLSKVRGIAFPQNGGVVTTPRRGFIRNLDLIEPAWNLVPWQEYTRSEERRVGKECRSRWSPD